MFSKISNQDQEDYNSEYFAYSDLMNQSEQQYPSNLLASEEIYNAVFGTMNPTTGINNDRSTNIFNAVYSMMNGGRSPASMYPLGLDLNAPIQMYPPGLGPNVPDSDGPHLGHSSNDTDPDRDVDGPDGPDPEMPPLAPAGSNVISPAQSPVRMPIFFTSVRSRGPSDSCKRRKELGEVRLDITDDIDIKICSICQSESNDEVIMTCGGMHSYCFKCIFSWIEKKKNLICPNCRKTCSHLIIPKVRNEDIKSFIEDIRLLRDPRRHDSNCYCYQDQFDNTCLYPKWIIAAYMENKVQLKIYKVLIKEFKESNIDVYQYIKFTETRKTFDL
jgi:hypothetical protein